MNDDEFTSAFNAPQAEDGFSKAFRTATSKQMPQAVSPWEAYGVPKYPAQESTLMRMGRGANVALTKAGTGLKGLFADLSEEDIAKLRAGEAYMQEAGLPATVGGLGVDIAAEAAAMTPMGKLPFLMRVLGAGGTAAALSPEDRTKAGMYGAAGQGVGEAVAKGLGAMFRGPSAAPGVREFVEAGGTPTIGQALGGTPKAFEEKLTSLPFLGGHVTEAQKRALESFNTSELQGIVNTLNKGIRTAPSQEIAIPGQAAVQRELVDLGKIEPTAEGFAKVKKAVSNAYDNLVVNTSGEMTPELATGIQGIKDLSKNLRPEFRTQIDDILNNSVISRFTPGQRVDGRTLKEMLSELRTSSESYSKSSIADERRVGDAAKEAASQLKQMMEVQNPRYAEALNAADNAYRDAKRMETAMTSSVGHEMATPASLLQALRGRNRPGYAEGKMPMQEEARRAQDIIGNRLPSSGSAERLNATKGFNELMGDVVGAVPGALMKYYGGAHFYSPAFQRMMVEQSLKEAGPIRGAIGQGLSRMGPYVGSVGAGAAQQGRR
jgi:hypothetical protein